MAHLLEDPKMERVSMKDWDKKSPLGMIMMGSTKKVDLEKRQLTIVATDETRDRDGDIIRLKGWKMENYKKNPVFLWAHDYSSVPLAAAVKWVFKRSPKQMVLTHQFPTAGIFPFADMILSLYHEKIINAGSVGFIPFSWEKLEATDEFKWGGREFTNQELMEHSGCAVPCNPAAVQDAIKSITAPKKMKKSFVDLMVKNPSGVLVPKNLDPVLAEIEDIKAKGIDEGFETDAVQVQVPDDIEPIDKSVEEEDVPEEESVEDEEKTETQEEEVETADAPEAQNKRGAVLSQKNKTALLRAVELIKEVLDSSESTDVEEEDQEEEGKGSSASAENGLGSAIEQILTSDSSGGAEIVEEDAGDSLVEPVADGEKSVDEKSLKQAIEALKSFTDTISSMAAKFSEK